MSTKKNRLNVSLDPIERQKLEQLANESGLSLSRTIAQLIRKAKSKPMRQQDRSVEGDVEIDAHSERLRQRDEE